MENIILKLNYRGCSLSIKVDDTDKCALIDVINELYDEVEANGVPLPKHPSLSYCYEMKSIDLLDDNGLLEMFTRVGERKVIDIWIGHDTVPSKVLSMARQVRANSMNSTAINTATPDVVKADGKPTSKPREKLPIRRNHQSPLTSIGSPSTTCQLEVEPFTFEPTSVQPNTDPPVFPQPPATDNTNPPGSVGVGVLSPKRSPRLNQTSPIRGSLVTPSPPNTNSVSPRRSARVTQTSPSQPVPSQHSSQVTNNTKSYKMPKATSKKRGLYMPKPVRDPVIAEGSQRMATRGARVEYEFEDNESDSDDSYEPSETEFADDVAAMNDLEVEDNFILSTLDCIDDGYDPYKQYEWVADEEGYSSKLYENGELCDCTDFGAIRLRPWMLFMDKDHFKDVLRDYCIQEGFLLLLRRLTIEDTRLTVQLLIVTGGFTLVCFLMVLRGP
ncbi:hypothetical protein RND81_10G049700 [Saponaria officinalis]|uniref:PB1 domain-containing protein n=1 Tax=Saponaria officinalis TaxID=3572 RepID=A0AAW1I0S9_SAPOF